MSSENEDLDYELEMDEETNLVIDEESLLESEEDPHETDTGLPLTTVVPTPPIQPSFPTLFRSTNVEGSEELSSSILSNDNVLNKSPERLAIETVEPEIATQETTESMKQVQQEVLQLVEEDIAPAQRNELESARTEETFEFEPLKSGPIEENIVSIDTKTPQQQSVDSNQMKQSDIRNISSSSSSTLSSTFATNTMETVLSEPIQPTVDHLVDVSTPGSSKVPKKNPFIIQAQSIGHTVSRTVLINPLFDGFENQNISKRIASQSDLSSSQMKKRKPAPKSEESAELPQSIAVIEEMSDEDKKYLQEIEKQKLKREEMLRLKKSRNEGWKFIE